VICLPMQGNFYGALLTGISTLDSKKSAQPEVLYCIGTQPGIPAGFTIYQNAFAPDQAKVDIGFPTAVFSERDGTFYNAELRQRPLVKAVEPPGISLPDWQILTAIARKMGAAGFDFQSTVEIREELTAAHPQGDWMKHIVSYPQVLQSDFKNEPIYLGSPLSTQVAGLRTLFPSGSSKAGER
jgi:NADH dehydrogenase/NADH:ubiquinone oxidoreductase subunit G